MHPNSNASFCTVTIEDSTVSHRYNGDNKRCYTSQHDTLILTLPRVGEGKGWRRVGEVGRRRASLDTLILSLPRRGKGEVGRVGEVDREEEEESLP